MTRLPDCVRVQQMRRFQDELTKGRYLHLNGRVRRKPGTLVPLEVSILCAAADLLAQDTRCFHGFQLARHVSGGTDQRRLTAYGALYRALARLERLGLLESRWEDPQVA